MLFASGKPRPGVVVQADRIETPIEILVCPLTTTQVDAPLYRVTIDASSLNGLTTVSQIMADKVGPVPRSVIARTIGRLAEGDLARLDVALATMLDLGV